MVQSSDQHASILWEWAGFGSLGDRVAKATVVAQISDDTEIIDPEARVRLEEIAADEKLDQDDLTVVKTLLGAGIKSAMAKMGYSTDSSKNR